VAALVYNAYAHLALVSLLAQAPENKRALLKKSLLYKKSLLKLPEEKHKKNS
jgi:hypothetical protein